MPLAAFPKCYLPALCQTRTMTVAEWIDESGRLDIDGLEFYWEFTPRQASARRELRSRVADQGRAIPMMCYSPDFTKLTAAERDAEVDAQRRVLEGCTDLGVTCCRVLSGQRRPGLDTDAALGWVAECIHALLPSAYSRGITLVLENHYKDGFWEYPEFAQRQDLFLRLVRAIGPHPAFGVNYDPSNALVAGDDPVALLEAVKDSVVAMHASDRYLKSGTLAGLRQVEATAGQGYSELLEHGVIGQGLNDYDRLLGILKQAGFTGWISIEDGIDPSGGFDRLDQSARFLRAKMRQHGLT